MKEMIKDKMGEKEMIKDKRVMKKMNIQTCNWSCNNAI
jgi:hypothetical protein